MSLETKKRKLLSEYEESLRKKVSVNEREDSLLNSFRNFSPILADEYFRAVETEKIFVGKVIVKKDTSRLIKEFSRIWPLEGKSHLKRVRWTPQKDVFEILIRPVAEDELIADCEVYSLEKVIGNADINASGLMDCVIVREIPKYPASTYNQYKESMKFWPVQFREDKYTEQILNDKLFTSEEKKEMELLMKMCISAAKYGDIKVGCIIVDPSSSKIIAIAHDCRNLHPMQHAIMVAIDLVARSQGGGSWNIDNFCIISECQSF
ncbi:probable inactive tRNA-specific adenosine deaminase-like protein 3 isoform X2 [Stegodyphus dumicola]|uniref:probable inactive tRNA-specific adenosine deaminase-like protein 3 isoform X2 n=1 Tax=Stegodyphus dumicola TaxID=202533 RepID=UPI0015A90D59|nr:probable inactive tRNA-specific adenosine deaminase-like protein 3 isoform X2 [Stegodyphus dumicola]